MSSEVATDNSVRNLLVFMGIMGILAAFVLFLNN
jgi:hypothetical protein